jgi:hypothetical protein
MESTAKKYCSYFEWEAAKKSGILSAPNGSAQEEHALHEFAEIIRKESQRELVSAVEVALVWFVVKIEPFVSGKGEAYDAYKRDENQLRSALRKATGEV